MKGEEVTKTTKDDLADKIDTIGNVLSAKDANRFRVQSYHEAADIIRDADMKTLVEDPESLDGIGDSLSDKIEEYWETGEIEKLNELRAEFNFDPEDLTEVEGIATKTAKKIHEELGVNDLDDLEEAAENGELREVPGLGPKTEDNVLEEIEMVRLGVNKRKDWDEVHEVWQGLRQRLTIVKKYAFGEKDTGYLKRFAPAGSLRRKSDTVGDLDVIVESDEPRKIFDNLEEWDEVDKVLARGDTKMSLRIGNLQIDIRVVETHQYGACLQYFTGSMEHNVALRKRANQLGYTLNEYGLFELEDGDKGEKVAGESEDEIYENLGFNETPQPQNRTQDWVWSNV